MSNATDFGVTAAKINKLINPGLSSYTWHIGAAYSGTGSAMSATGWKDSTATWRPDQWNDWRLFRNNTYYPISDTSLTQLTVDGSVAGATGAYTITAQSHIETADATAVVTQVVGEIKSQLPEKYRRLLTSVEGEVITYPGAYYEQPTAHTTYVVSPITSLHLWRNFNGNYAERSINGAMYSPVDLSSGLTSFTDYTVGTASTRTVVTFQFGGNTANRCNKGDLIIADYDHELSTVPIVLERVALHMAAYEILARNGVGNEEMPEMVRRNREEAMETLTAIKDGKAGIDEFDRMHLYTETRAGGGTGWGSALFLRG